MPHTHTLACPSTGKDELSRWHWSDTHFLLASLALCFFLSLLLLFPPHAFLSSERTSRLFLYLRAVSTGQSAPRSLLHGNLTYSKNTRTTLLLSQLNVERLHKLKLNFKFDKTTWCFVPHTHVHNVVNQLLDQFVCLVDSQNTNKN